MMSKTHLVKTLLSDTLKELSKKKSLDKITITDIIKAAGISRPTFYYHFADKEELISWIFRTDLEKIVNKITRAYALRDRALVNKRVYQGKPFYIIHNVQQADKYLTSYWHDLLVHLAENKSFYTVAFDPALPGNLRDHLYSLFYNSYLEELLTLRPKHIINDNILFIANFVACAITGFIELWVKQGMPSTDGISEQFCDVTHRCLEFICRTYNV